VHLVGCTIGMLTVSVLDHLRVTGLEPSSVTSWHTLLSVVRGREHFNRAQPACPRGSLINIAVGATPFAHSCQLNSGVHFGTALRVEIFNLLRCMFFGMLHVPASALVLV
jgi:hypothetical protein